MRARAAAVAPSRRVRSRDHLAAIEWPALGTTARLVVTDPGALEPALRQVAAAVESVDAAANRFRPDSEVRRLQAAGGAPVVASPTLVALLSAALEAARATGGLVDPTVGVALVALGYDRDCSELGGGPAPPLAFAAGGDPAWVAGWRTVRLDRGRVAVPAGVLLDLGATGKAWCADRAAALAAGVTGAGVLVSLGGDLATSGPVPDGGWIVRIAEDHRAVDPAAPLIRVRWGGVATSSTVRRRWWTGRGAVHHIVDPRTGASARSPWRTVTVAAPSCVAANTLTTAAIVAGGDADRLLGAARVPARLVASDGTVVRWGGWPEPDGRR